MNKEDREALTITKPYEGTEAGTVTALYPHQWKYTNEKLSALTKYTYASVRGVMKVARARG